MASREYLVKAAFIYNFTQFIEWPDNAFDSKDSPFIVAVVGDDPFNGALEQAMADKVVGTHTIVIQHYDSPDHIGKCQLLFVSAAQDSSLKAIMDKLNSKPTLTVGESDAFLAVGGGIRFFLDDKRMKFDIAPDSIEGVGLQVSAKLMKLARIFKR